MLQILIPMAGSSTFFNEEEFQYPKPLVEINGIPMIQLVVENLLKIDGPKQFILTDYKAKIVKLKSPTKGAVCSSLMAIDLLDKNLPLLISNGDQIIESINNVVDFFVANSWDGGVATFQSVHPKWSFVRMEGNEVIETTEKKPISRQAIAGLYYYQQADSFIKAAFQVLLKDDNVEGVYYLSSSMNELILKNLKVGNFLLSNKDYHSFYSPQKIKEFENQKH
jgi:dTDP-glucose pyrophosphorylase